MCGRYRLSRRKQIVEEYFDTASDEQEWAPRFNIAPTQPVPVIRQNPNEPVRELSLMRWGLIPSWAKDSSAAAGMINARAETAATKPAFRDALKLRRCLIPADGFYEWMRTGKAKQPYCFEVNEGELFAFAYASAESANANVGDEPTPLIVSAPVVEPAPVIKAADMIELLSIMEPAPCPMSDHEWEVWKRQYWHDEKLRAKNERFLSAVSSYVGRVSDLMHSRNDVAAIPGSDAVKSMLRELRYKSKVVFYNFKGFDQGIIVHESPHQPILWASNGHIGISAFLFFNAYVQHGLSRQATLRFDWDGIPILFELPEKGDRKLHTGT